MPDPLQENPYQASNDETEFASSIPTTGDGTGGVIPYRNPSALIAYYLGLFSFIPVIGLILAVPAFVLGIMGLIAKKRNPVVRGSIHAWVGIIMGGIFSLVWGGSLCVLLLRGFFFAM